MKTFILDWKIHIWVKPIVTKYNINYSSVRQFLAKFQISKILDRKYGLGWLCCSSKPDGCIITKIGLKNQFDTSSQHKRDIRHCNFRKKIAAVLKQRIKS